MSEHTEKAIQKIFPLICVLLIISLDVGCAKKSGGDGGGASLKATDSASAAGVVQASLENKGDGDAAPEKAKSVAVDTLTVSDTVLENKEGGKLSFKKYELTISDAENNIDEISVSFTYPVAIPNPAALAELQKNFVKQLFGEKYVGLEPAEIVRRVGKAFVEEVQTFSQNDDRCQYDFSYSDNVPLPDSGFLCYQTFYSEYTCGAHPNGSISAGVYSLADGKKVELKDIFVKGWEGGVTKLIIEKYLKEEGEESLEDIGFAEEKDFMPTGDMFLSFGDSSGVTFVYNTYQISGYAHGPQYILVPWDKLRPFLNKGSVIYPKIQF